MVSSARAQKAGDTFSVKDIKVSVCAASLSICVQWPFDYSLAQFASSFIWQATGKELNRDIRREELTRKKSRVEEKLAELRAKMDDTS